jgi:hypothetical protein
VIERIQLVVTPSVQTSPILTLNYFFLYGGQLRFDTPCLMLLTKEFVFVEIKIIVENFSC